MENGFALVDETGIPEVLSAWKRVLPEALQQYLSQRHSQEDRFDPVEWPISL